MFRARAEPVRALLRGMRAVVVFHGRFFSDDFLSWLAPRNPHFIPKFGSQSTLEVRSPIACGWRVAC